MQKREAVVKQAVATLERHTTFSGPIPPPDILAHYEKIAPGFAERILAMAERQTQSRIALEEANAEIAKRDVPAARMETRRGQWMSFAITILALASAIVCAWMKQPAVAVTIAGATLASIVSSIMRQRPSSP